MTVAAQIEDALQPLRAELTTSCIACGEALPTFSKNARTRLLHYVCRRCVVELADELHVGSSGGPWGQWP